MNKRVLCLVLCLVLLLPAVLAGCKKDSNIEDKFQQTATTLTMWVVTSGDENVSEEAQKLVAAKLDEITKNRFKVHLVVKYISEDVYRETLDNEIRGFYETRAYITPKTDDESTPAETEVNEWGITVIKYPALLEHQVDIIYLQGEEMFKTYAKNGWLASLNIELNGNSKAIRSNVNSHLLSAATYNGDILAIPNNHALGEYTVMLLNKELMAETNTDAIYRQGKIDGFFNKYIYNYLEEIKSKGDESILPVNASYSECLDLLAYYWNVNPDTLENEGGLSVIGYRYEDLSEISRSVPLAFNSLFTDEEFTKAFLKLKEYQFDGGYFGATEGEKTAALSIATMGYEELAAYRAEDSEYYPVILKNPTLSAEDVYGSMFGICSQTDSVEHCMKVLTLLNTNSEFRNVLQYGVEGKTYQLVPDPNDNQKRIISYSEEYPYHMDIFKTGNAFLAYPEPGMDETVWENGKVQNRDVTGADPTLDLDIRSLALATMDQGDEEPILGTKDYIYSVKTGLDRSVYLQNPVLKEWIEKCDETGAGTYLLQGFDPTQSIYHTDFYVYSNQYKADFEVLKDAEGNLNFALTGTQAGSTIAAVTFDFKSTAKTKAYVTVNGANNGVPTTTRLIRIPFDSLNTEIYQVRLRAEIALSSISSNPVLWQWFTENCKEAEAGSLQVLQSQKEMANGKTKYTYLVYAPGLEYLTNVAVDPKGSATALELDLLLNDTDLAVDPEYGDRTYALFLVTVETDETVESVQFNLYRNGTAVQADLFVPETDPDFTLFGTLDSELIRYIYKLNGELVARIEACTNMEELKALLLDVKRLLTPHSDNDWYLNINQRDSHDIPVGYQAEEAQYTALSDLVATLDLEEVNYMILSATSSTYVARKDAELNPVNDKIEVVEVVDYLSGEEYEQLDSPYMLYAAWLKNNRYTN